MEASKAANVDVNTCINVTKTKTSVMEAKPTKATATTTAPTSKKINRTSVKPTISASDLVDSLSMVTSVVGNNNLQQQQPQQSRQKTRSPVKMTIARKTTQDGKRSGGATKRSHSNRFDDSMVGNLASDFKSLRSNDMRYSEYIINSTTTTTLSSNSSKKNNSVENSGNNSGSKGHNNNSVNRVKDQKSLTSGVLMKSMHLDKDNDGATNYSSFHSNSNVAHSRAKEKITSHMTPSSGEGKCEVVVSIPQSQLSKSAYDFED